MKAASSFCAETLSLLVALAASATLGGLAACEDGGASGMGGDVDVQDERPRPRTDAGGRDADDRDTTQDDGSDDTVEQGDAADDVDTDAGDASTETDTTPTDASSDTDPVDADDDSTTVVDTGPDVVDPGPAPDDLETDTFDCPDRWAGSTIRITEVMIDPNNAEGQRTATEWFEVTNIGTTSVDFDGVSVADLNSDEFIIGEESLPYEGFYQLADDSAVEPGEWFPFYQRVTTVDCRESTDPDCKAYIGEHFYVFRRDMGMAIGNSGDEIYITDRSGHLLDCFDYGSADETEGQSWQRMPTEDGLGFTDTWCLTYLREPLRYNDNDDDVRAGDYGTPGSPFRCW